MANTPDGGQAFPFPDPQGPAPGAVLGLSLRDWFAGQALPQAIKHERLVRASMIAPSDFRYSAVADAAYFMADAMLAAREK